MAANSADAVLLVGADGRILEDAPAFVQLIGAPPQSTVGVDPTTLIHGDHVADLRADFGLVLATAGAVIETEVRVPAPTARTSGSPPGW